MIAMSNFNIYITGVGGQGIGLLSEIILRACDYAGKNVIGVDTHGLAQRGGIVESFVRIGDNIHSPLIEEGHADLVVALERHEALRGTIKYLRKGGALVYYDTVWQPLFVRLGQCKEIKNENIQEYCASNQMTHYCVVDNSLPDVRMQNIAVLKKIADVVLIPDVKKENYEKAMSDLMEGATLEKNLALLSTSM